MSMDMFGMEDGYFTREEINELMSDINDELLKKRGLHGVQITAIFYEEKEEGNILEADIADNEGYYAKTLKWNIDTDKADTFQKLEKKYSKTIINDIVNDYKEFDREIKELYER